MAQLDNAADSDSEERGFKSLWAGQKNQVFGLGFFHLCPQDITSFSGIYVADFITALAVLHFADINEWSYLAINEVICNEVLRNEVA